MKIERTCMRDPIRDLIVSRILEGRYPPGTRLKEMAIATECSVSQAPVREAFRELEALGLLESLRYRGTRVRDMDGSELADAYELRLLIEERAAQLVVPCAETLLKDLRASVEDMRRAQRRRDVDAHYKAAVHFHRALVAASGNRAFLQAWDSQHWQVRARVAMKHLVSAGDAVADLVESHAQVLKALELGDGRLAGRHLREQIEKVQMILASPAVSTAPPAAAKARALTPRTARRRIAHAG